MSSGGLSGQSLDPPAEDTTDAEPDRAQVDTLLVKTETPNMRGDDVFHMTQTRLPVTLNTKEDSVTHRTQTQLPETSSGECDSGIEIESLLSEASASERKYDIKPHSPRHLTVICNTHFNPSLGLGERRGTDKDIEAIKRVFVQKLGFTVDIKQDLTAAQMLQLISTTTMTDIDKHASCFALVIMTHGKSEGKLYGTDKEIKLEQLLKPVKDCDNLVGKPKMVFIQACRGAEYDYGKKMSQDDGGEAPGSLTIPVEADFLYVYSTADGYVAFQNPTNGSWFIQTLCRVLEQNYEQHDMLTMLTRVCYALAYDFSSHTPSRPSTDKLKQVSSVTTTLTKILRF